MSSLTTIDKIALAVVTAAALGITVALGVPTAKSQDTQKPSRPGAHFESVDIMCVDISMDEAIKNMKLNAGMVPLASARFGGLNSSIPGYILVNQETGIWAMIMGSDDYYCGAAAGINFTPYVGK